DFPEEAKKIPQVGNYAGLNIEAIVALQPDVIIYWPEGNPARDIERLKQLKMPLFASDPNTFVEIADDIKRFGALTGNIDSSEKIATAFLQEVEQVRQDNENKQSLRVFYQVWNQPLLSQNGDTFISRVINLCGGENIFADLPIKSPQISIEAVLTENPDIILVGATDGQRPEWLDGWQQYGYLKAVKNNQLKTVDADVIHRPTLRLLDATKQVCAVFDELRAL
ncbi:MAG TPA: cobalamin-binding protein, partial [Pseudomonadales bacterium]|nr:cobalamin-binding protein [Pseudomonadales bacterium]